MLYWTSFWVSISSVFRGVHLSAILMLSKVCFVLIFILLQCLLSCVDFLSSDCSSELVLIKFLSYDYQVLPNFGNA